MSLAGRIRRAALRPVDPAGLTAFRVLFGLVLLIGVLRFIASGWIPRFYAEPTFFFKYPGFEWVQPWPLWGMYLHYGVLAALALCITVGFHHRIACLLFAAGFAYTQLIDVTNYLNHHYLVVLLAVLLAWVPADRAWGYWMLRLQVGVVYVFAGLAKLESDWLLHAQPLNLWLTARTETPIIGPLFDQPWMAYAMSWAGFLFDTTIVLWLSWRRTRLPAYAVLLGFHLMTGLLFNIGMFPFIMTVAALVFFSPGWPRKLLGGVPRVARPPSPVSRWRTLGAAAAVTWCVVQVAVPLRHYAYPGCVLWNEDGMRFSWKVMVREKHGAVTYRVVRADGRTLQVSPRRYLDARQEREMAGQPDLILQLAHHVAEDMRALGHGEVAVYAETAVSLNGRPPQPMIDPEVDLVGVRDGLAPRTWVLAEPDRPPIHLRPRWAAR